MTNEKQMHFSIISHCNFQLEFTEKRIAPGKYWTYKEKSLDDIYDETYPFEE